MCRYLVRVNVTWVLQLEPEIYVSKKVRMWSGDILTLSNIAETHPHSAYSAFTHSVKHRWNYVMHTIESVGAFFQPLEEALHQHLLPALTGRMPSSEVERELLSLPCRSGGLNIPNPTCCSDFQFSSSKLLSASLVAMIQQQTFTSLAFSRLHQSRQQMLTSCLANIQSRVDPQLQRTIELINVKCSSLWLTALPLQEQGFHLNKQEFRDALCLRYGWQLANIPSHCVCGTSFSVDHAMICRHGGLTFIHHNELRDLTAQWLREVCHDVTVEPPLLPLDGEIITPTSANCSALFDVRVFHPNTPSDCQTRVASLFRRHELEKKREYGDRIRNVDCESFTPLVFSTFGGLGKEAIFYNRLADLLSQKHNTSYNQTLSWMRCALSFSLLRSAFVEAESASQQCSLLSPLSCV